MQIFTFLQLNGLKRASIFQILPLMIQYHSLNELFLLYIRHIFTNLV